MNSKALIQALTIVALASPLLQTPALSVDTSAPAAGGEHVVAAPPTESVAPSVKGFPQESVAETKSNDKATSEGPIGSTLTHRDDKIGIFVISGIFAAILAFIVMASLRKNP